MLAALRHFGAAHPWIESVIAPLDLAVFSHVYLLLSIYPAHRAAYLALYLIEDGRFLRYALSAFHFILYVHRSSSTWMVTWIPSRRERGTFGSLATATDSPDSILAQIHVHHCWAFAPNFRMANSKMDIRVSWLASVRSASGTVTFPAP